MKRLLVVDDQKVMGDIIREIFADVEICVDVVYDAPSALEYLKTKKTDLIISDVMMPGVKGTNLFFSIKEINPFAQVIIITAYPSKKDVLHMVKSGACDFLLKPFDPDDLQKVVTSAFEKLERWEPLRQECDLI